MVTRFEIIRIARKYIGVQFQLYGRSPVFGLDCWGFFERLCNDLKIPCSHISNSKYDNLLRVVLLALRAMEFKEVKIPIFGDLLVRVHNRELAGHIGIITDEMMIHATKDGIQETKIIGSWIGFKFPGVE